MNIKTIRSSKGWDSIFIELRTGEIDHLIELLHELRGNNISHFHIRNDTFSEQSSVADIEFSKFEDASSNFSLD